MPQDRVEAVDRALSILSAFNEDDLGLSLAELSRRTGLYKSTILRLLGSLKASGFVTLGSDGLYSLGPDLWRLGSYYRRRYLPSEIVMPVLERLRDLTKETASFYVRDGENRICLYRVNSERPMRHHLVQGARLPLERGAAGRVLLAFGPESPISSQEVRYFGHAISLGERDPEIAAISVPVVDDDGKLLGALAVSGLITRFSEAACETHLDHLRQEARSLTG